MADSNNNRVQIIVAVIGLIGVLGTAVITNWKQFSHSAADNRSSEITRATDKITQPTQPSKIDKGRASLQQETPNTGDFTSIISASRPGGIPGVWQRGQIMDFDVRVEYSASSFEKGWLYVHAVEFPTENGGCSGKGGRIVADDQGRVDIERGHGEKVVSVRWYGDDPSLSANEKLHGMTGLGSGWVGLRADLLSYDQKFYQAGKMAQICYPFR